MEAVKVLRGGREQPIGFPSHVDLELYTLLWFAHSPITIGGSHSLDYTIGYPVRECGAPCRQICHAGRTLVHTLARILAA